VNKRQEKILELTNAVLCEKNLTKIQEKTIQNVVNEIHKIVQEKDEQSYVSGLEHIYEKYVK